MRNGGFQYDIQARCRLPRLRQDGDLVHIRVEISYESPRLLFA